MTADRVQRRMAAILAADVVGYSRLMGKDEESTLATLKIHRSAIDKLIASHAGRIFGSAGDSVIAEFASPVDAVRCATEIQLEVGKRNANVPEPSRMRFRIGVNLGDVVVDGDNLMGDGVNVAARLEALAQPGGLCISEAIHAQVRDRLSLDFLDLGEHSMKNITRPVRAYRVPLASEEQVKSPFRGLDVFDFDHADIFFGRARATTTCSERLQQLAASGSAFLLIYGMSGSGKSSLLRAGLLPAITQPGAAAGIGLWRRGLFRPSEGSDAIESLVAGLIQESALPELTEERTAAELADLLRANPDRAPALVRAAIGKAATAAGIPPSQARLVLAVDQMEELFTTQAEPASREVLVRLLAAFAASGLVWVIGTIRADFFHRCGEVPGFSALKDGLGSYELLPPTGPEIAQIIREPARAAGLRFEQAADQGHLDDVLQDAAAADPGSLPLLEFVLDALYEAGRERRLLTFAAYRALGGLEGAIARRADEIVDALPPDGQDALPAVLRALTTVRPGDEAITASPAELIEVAGTSARSVLVNALIGARLLISDESAEGVAVIRVAHEALLTRWPRARDIINANRAFLETRARLQADARRWQLDNRNAELLLPAGKRLAEGEELLSARSEEIDDHIVEYIEASSQAEKERQEKDRHAERALIEAAEAAKRERLEREAERRSLEESAQRERLEREAERQSIEAAAAKKLARRTRIAAGIALLLAIGAGAGAVVGFSGQREAIRQTERAEKNASDAQAAATKAQAAETQAIEAKNQALQNQSLSLAFLAQRTAENGDTEAAILLALEALPTDMSASERPFLFEAEAALYNALAAHRQTLILRHPAGVTHAVFSPNGERIVSSSYDNTARVWSAGDGSEIAVLTGHRGAIESAKFSPDGSRILTVARDSTARIWDARSGKQLFVLGGIGSSFAFHKTAIFSPDGSQMLTAGTGEINLWNADTGEKSVTVESRSPSLAAFSPDGRTFAAGDERPRTVSIWSAEDGRLISTWGVDTWPDEVAFSPDGGRLLVNSWGSSFGNRPMLPGQCRVCLSRLWNVSSGTELATFSGHRSDTRGGTFSHDGRLIATVSMDGTARLWNGITGELLSELGDETPGLKIGLAGVGLQDQDVNSAFSPDDTLLATVSLEDNVRIWDVAGASEFTIIHGHTDLVEHVEFSPDGGRLLTASHDGTARIWDVDGVLTTTLHHLTTPTFAAFSSDGVRIVTLGADSAAHVWETATGKKISTLVDRDSGPLQHATFSPDGRNVVTASESGRLTSWDAENAREVARFKGHERRVVNVQFSPDGRLLLSTSLDGTARLWDASQGTPTTVLQVGATIRNARFSPDGSLVLAGSKDGGARLWRIDGSEFRQFTVPNSQISAAAFSPDGRLIATGSFDGTAQLWSIEDGKLINTLKGPNALIANIEFSLDGQFVVAAYRDGTTRIWSVNDGAEQAVLGGHRVGVDRATFSPNGLNVVTASSADRTVRLWERELGRQIAIIAGQEDTRDVEPAPTSAAYSPDGTMIAIVGDEQSVRIMRAFPTPHDLIDYAHRIVPRELTPCERQRFFLPIESEVGNCPS